MYKWLIILLAVCYVGAGTYGQSTPAADTLYNEAALVELLAKQAAKDGYAKRIILVNDTASSFTAKPSVKYRLMLVFSEGNTSASRRLVAERIDRAGKKRNVYTAKTVTGIKEFGARIMVTDIPAADSLASLQFKIDVQPKNGRLHIFSN